MARSNKEKEQEQVVAASEAAAEQIVGEAESVNEDMATAVRAAEHPNTSDKALVEALTASEVRVKELEEALAKLEAENTAELQKAEADAAEGTTTYWLADPRSRFRLWNPEAEDFIQFRNGRYHANAQEAKLIEQHMAGMAFKQDRTNPRQPHPVTGYAPMSDAAYDAHIELVTRV